MWSFYLLENEDNTEESRAEKKDEQIPGTVWLSWIQLYLKLTLGLSNTVPLGGLQFTMASVTCNQEFYLVCGFIVRAARLPAGLAE